MSSGATFRKAKCVEKDVLELTAVGRETSSNNGRFECEVSEVDKLFPPDFPIQGPNKGTLRKQNRWKDVLEQLEEKAIAKTITFCRGTSSYKETFKIPVSGHNIYDTKKEDDFHNHLYNYVDTKKNSVDKMIKQNPHDFFHWNGAYYNINYLYGRYLDRGCLVLKRLRPLLLPMPKLKYGAIELPKSIQKVYDASGKKKSNFVHIHHENNDLKYSARYIKYNIDQCWTAKDEKDFLEIRFAAPTHVSNIGTLGGGFYSTYFPEKSHVARKRNLDWVEFIDGSSHRLYEDHNMSELSKKCATYIRTIDGFDSVAWVSSYLLSYRKANGVGGTKWIKLGTFAANSNAFDEAVIDLHMWSDDRKGLLADAIRIQPLTFHTKATMKISIYGFGNNFKDETNVLTDAETDIPTIDYVISTCPSLTQQQQKDKNTNSYYHNKWWLLSRHKRRNERRSDIIEGLDNDEDDHNVFFSDFDETSREDASTDSNHDSNYNAFSNDGYGSKENNEFFDYITDGSSYNFLNDSVQQDWPDLENSGPLNVSSTCSSKVERSYLLALIGSSCYQKDEDSNHDEDEYVFVSDESNASHENCNVS
jgi:hypothetical protein